MLSKTEAKVNLHATIVGFRAIVNNDNTWINDQSSNYAWWRLELMMEAKFLGFALEANEEICGVGFAKGLNKTYRSERRLGLLDGSDLWLLMVVRQQQRGICEALWR